MCILDEMKRGVKQHDIPLLRKVVCTFRSCGLSYVKVANMFYSHCDLEFPEIDNLMQEIDHSHG